MASAVTHTDKTTTPLTYHYPITLLFTFVFTPYKKLLFYLLSSLRLTKVVLLILTLLHIYLCYIM